jgi:NAD(P)-dependent dehydrogenase (short-subunit alcohol dehydrogenase family)
VDPAAAVKPFWEGGSVPSVLITGASRGIGRACALRLDRRGFDVIAGVRSEEAGRRLAAEAAGRLRVVQLDVVDAESVRAAATAVGDRLDVLVNNAGIAVGGIVESLPLDDLRHQLEVNVVGQVAVTQALLPALRAAAGRIVFISSVSGRASVPALTPYSASKFALEAIADGLRVELRAWDIDVVLIEPGSIDTDIWRSGEQQLDHTVTSMSEEHRRLYGRLLTGTRKLVVATAKRAAPVEKVVDVVERAVTAERPRARYVVGADAKAQLALRSLLPTRAYDALLARMLGV